MINIRKANKEDFDTLVAIFQKADDRSLEWSIEKAKSFLSSSVKGIFLAFDNEKPIGYIGIKEREEDENVEKFIDTNNAGTITWIALIEEYRGKNIGPKLMEIAEKAIKKLFNKNLVWLDCREDRVNFYKRNGYEEKGHYLKKNKKQYVMLKKLS